MSEYSKFLNYFNSKKGSEKPDGGAPAESGAPAPAELTYIGEEADAKTGGDREKEDVSFRRDGSRFINEDQAETISAKDAGTPTGGTAGEPSGDSPDGGAEEAEEHTGYTGKIDTVSANAGAARYPAQESTTRAIPGSVFEAAKSAQKIAPAEDDFAEDKTKHISLPGEEPADASDADSAPTKHIGGGKGSLLMEIAKTNAEEAGEDPEQLKLDGFFNQDEKKREEEEHSEKELRKELRKTRQKRINDFHFWSKERTEAGKSPDGAFASGPESSSLPEMLRRFTAKFEGLQSGFLTFRCDEYKDPNDHRTIFKKLMDIRRNTLIRSAILGLLGLILLIINIVASVSAAAHNGFFAIMGGNVTAYVSVNLIFLALASFLVFDDIREGIVSLLQGHPKTDASLVFLLTVTFIQTVGAYLTKQNPEADFHLLTGAAILLCVPMLLAKTFYYDNTRHCFKSIAAKSEKSYLRRLSDKNLVTAVLGDADRGDAEVVYAGRTRFIRNFIARSRSSAAGGQISSRITLIAMAGSFLIGLIAMIIKANVMWGLSVMCFSAALSFPIGCLFFTGFMIANENKALSVKSSFVRSYSDARDMAKVENIVVRAEDIFNVEITETVCIDSINRQQAELCAAVITEKTGGLLKKAFPIPETIKEDAVPEAEQLTYEDKLGFSAWVSDCRVLLGSNAFLSNHNVKMPDESGVLNFIDSENKPIYLAIEGHFTAMFSARYTCASEHVRRLKTLADNGANILIVSSDPNITDTFAEKLLGVPTDSVRVISKSAAEKIAVQQDTVTDSEDTGIVFSGGDSLCRCAFSAVKLDKLKKLSKLICEICCCTGCVLALAFALFGAVSAVSGWLTVLLQLLGMVLCFFIPPLLTASSMPAFSRSAVHPVSRNAPYTPDNYVPRPQKIRDEEDEPDETPEEEADAPTETDEDMKIAEPAPKKRFGRFSVRPDWGFDDDDDDDDDDFDLPPRRKGMFAGKRTARPAEAPVRETPGPAAEEAPAEERESFMAKVPENPDDIHMTTEELLQTHYFREDDEEPARRRAPSPVNRYEEEEEPEDTPDYGAERYDDEDEYDDDDGDLFGDGLIGKIRNLGKKGKRSGRSRGPAYDDYDDYGDPYDDEPYEEEEPAPEPARKPKGRKGKRPGLGALKDLAGKVTSAAGNAGRRPAAPEEDYDDIYDEEEEDYAPAERRRTEPAKPEKRPAAAPKQERRPSAPSATASARPSILSFATEDPAPPHYELGKTDEYDFLNVKFEPPAVRTGNYYNDAYFSRYETDTVEDDADTVFSGLTEKKP